MLLPTCGTSFLLVPTPSDGDGTREKAANKNMELQFIIKNNDSVLLIRGHLPIDSMGSYAGVVSCLGESEGVECLLADVVLFLPTTFPCSGVEI